MLLTLLQADIAAEAVAQPQLNFSLIDMALKGGWLMVPLFILSIITIYLFGMKWWAIRKATKVDPNFMKDIHDYIHEGKMKAAVAMCQQTDTPVARLVTNDECELGIPPDPTSR